MTRDQGPASASGRALIAGELGRNSRNTADDESAIRALEESFAAALNAGNIDALTGWENVSIADLPVGTNVLAFSRTNTGRGIQYRVEATQDGWKFVLKAPELSGASYYLNGRPVTFNSSGFRMSGRKNYLLVVPVRAHSNGDSAAPRDAMR